MLCGVLHPFWKAEYPFSDISVHIENTLFVMLFPTHPFVLSNFEVEFSLTLTERSVSENSTAKLDKTNGCVGKSMKSRVFAM